MLLSPPMPSRIAPAAPLVVVRAVDDGVDPLRLVAGRDAVGVVAVAGAGRDVDAVRPLAVDGGRGRLRVGEVVPSARSGPTKPPGGAWVRRLFRPDWS